MRLTEIAKYSECHLIVAWSWHFPRLWRSLTYLSVIAGLNRVFLGLEIRLHSCCEGIKVAENDFLLQICFIANVPDMHLPIHTVYWELHLKFPSREILICLGYSLLVEWEAMASWIFAALPSNCKARKMWKNKFSELWCKKVLRSRRNKIKPKG